MTPRRYITRDDIHIKARLMSEGVRLRGVRLPTETELAATSAALPDGIDFDDVEQVLEQYAHSLETWDRTSRQKSGVRMILEGSGLKVMVQPNPYSRLELVVEDGAVSVFDGNEVVATGHEVSGQPWLEERLSNGLPVATVLPAASDEIINLVFSLSCANAVVPKNACRYCNLFANPISRKLVNLPLETLEGWARYQAEALAIAVDGGWSGTIGLTGGALPPRQRGEAIERMGVVLSAMRTALGEDLFARQKIIYNNYPPEDLDDMWRWKELGIAGTSIDLEVMDPAYFAAICPGKNAYRPHEYWRRAQEKSVEVFGPYLNTTGCVVLGIEPMDAFVAGVEERLSKRVLPFPLSYYSAPGSAYSGFRPPSPDWFVTAAERFADACFASGELVSHLLSFSDGGVASSLGFDPTRLSERSSPMSIVFDEVFRRAQELMPPRMEDTATSPVSL